MSLFTLADLHLSVTGEKPMDVFGARWTDYMQKIKKNWSAVVSDGDTVILPGDVSWALKLEETADDFRFLNALPGKKLLGKGNHDFWWSTASKMNLYFRENGFDTFSILYNNAYLIEGRVVCGSRGWFVEENQQNTVGTVDYLRIVNREVIRLRMSLDEAVKLRDAVPGKKPPIIVFLHFPPVWREFVCREIVDVLHDYGIRDCYFGHIHGAYASPPVREFEGIRMTLCSADYLKFTPLPVFADEN